MKILRLAQVEAKTGLKHSAIYERIADGNFPKPIPLGKQARGFLESEVDAWIRTQAAKRDSRNSV
jgi:prophage regulatory protein